ncbi:MAG: hypothetical protein JNJ61_25700 [Anaerolineae bacterium]|nr:hypothetical protein [Anaerolineae bacterium]
MQDAGKMIILDERRKAILDDIDDLIEQIDRLLERPDPVAEQALLARIRLLQGDVQAEFLARDSRFRFLAARYAGIPQ